MTSMLALDTSTTATGYALFADGKLQFYNVVTLDDVPREERIGKMIGAIYSIIDDYDPDIIVTELTSMTRNAVTQRNLTMILGAVLGKCVEDNIYYHSFRASEWRKLVDPDRKPKKREELKQWSIDKVNSFLKTEINNDNIADAILIGMAYINLFKK